MVYLAIDNRRCAEAHTSLGTSSCRDDYENQTARQGRQNLCVTLSKVIDCSCNRKRKFSAYVAAGYVPPAKPCSFSDLVWIGLEIFPVARENSPLLRATLDSLGRSGGACYLGWKLGGHNRMNGRLGNRRPPGSPHLAGSRLFV